MLRWKMNLLCKVGWHHGTWVYDSGPVEFFAREDVGCAQTRICRRCGLTGVNGQNRLIHPGDNHP